MRQLLLAPVIIALAFTLPTPLCVVQVVAGVAYAALGICALICNEREKRDTDEEAR